MALVTIDLQLPRKSGSQTALPELWPTSGVDIISCQRLYSDPAADYFRLEALTDEELLPQLELDIRRNHPEAICRYRTEPEIFSGPLIEVQATRKVDFRRAFVTTSTAAVRRAERSLYASRESAAQMLSSRRFLLLSEGGALAQSHLAALHLERDAFLAARWTDAQPTPLRISPRNEEEFIRTALALSENGFALRLSRLNPEYALDVAERLQEQAACPVIHAEFSETAAILAAAMTNAARLRGAKVSGASVAILGLGPAGHGLKEFAVRLGAARIFGIDAETRQLTRFERKDGIASSIDHVYNAADIVVVTSEFNGRLEEQRFRPEQTLLSFSDAVDPRRMSTEVHNRAFLGPELHPVFALPGLVAGLQRSKARLFRFDHAWAIYESLLLREGDCAILPAPSSELIARQSEAVAAVRD